MQLAMSKNGVVSYYVIKNAHLEITRVIAESLDKVLEEQKLAIAELLEAVKQPHIHGAAEAGTLATRVHPALPLRY